MDYDQTCVVNKRTLDPYYDPGQAQEGPGLARRGPLSCPVDGHDSVEPVRSRVSGRTTRDLVLLVVCVLIVLAALLAGALMVGLVVDVIQGMVEPS